MSTPPQAPTSPARGLKPQDPNALNALRRLVPTGMREAVRLDASGHVDPAPLRALASRDRDAADLLALASSKQEVVVELAATPCRPESEQPCYPFFYKSVEEVRREAAEYGLTIEDPIAELYLGLFEPATAATAARVVVASPQVGAPADEQDRTLRHELFGHAQLYVKGKPWKHGTAEQSDSAPDRVFLDLEARPIHR